MMSTFPVQGTIIILIFAGYSSRIEPARSAAEYPHALQQKAIIIGLKSSAILIPPISVAVCRFARMIHSLWPALCPLHPALCPLPSALCPLPSALCTLHPVPCSLHPAPCSLFPAPCTLFPALYALSTNSVKHPLTMPQPCSISDYPHTSPDQWPLPGIQTRMYRIPCTLPHQSH